MLNHEAWRISREIELKYENKKTDDGADPMTETGYRMSEITSDGDKLNSYLADWSAFG